MRSALHPGEQVVGYSECRKSRGEQDRSFDLTELLDLTGAGELAEPVPDVESGGKRSRSSEVSVDDRRHAGVEVPPVVVESRVADANSFYVDDRVCRPDRVPPEGQTKITRARREAGLGFRTSDHVACLPRRTKERSLRARSW